IEEKVSERITVYPIIYVPKDSKIPIRIYGFVFGWRLLKLFRKHNIKVVYSHAEELGFWVQSKKIRMVHHLHTFVNVLQVSGRQLSKSKMIQSWWNILREGVIKKSYKIVAVNDDIVEMGNRLIGIQKVIKLPNFINYNHFKYREDRVSLQEQLNLCNFKVLLYVGRISKVKGLELFVDVLQKLNSIDRSQWKGIIIGNGEYEKAIREYIKSKMMEDDFILKGAIN